MSNVFVGNNQDAGDGWELTGSDKFQVMGSHTHLNAEHGIKMTNCDQHEWLGVHVDRVSIASSNTSDGIFLSDSLPDPLASLTMSALIHRLCDRGEIRLEGI